MTELTELQEIYKNFWLEKRSASDEECLEILSNLNKNKTLGELFYNLLTITADYRGDITDPKIKIKLKEYSPVLLVLKRINKPGLPKPELSDIQKIYQDAVEFFSNLKQVA